MYDEYGHGSPKEYHCVFYDCKLPTQLISDHNIRTSSGGRRGDREAIRVIKIGEGSDIFAYIESFARLYRIKNTDDKVRQP